MKTLVIAFALLISTNVMAEETENCHGLLGGKKAQMNSAREKDGSESVILTVEGVSPEVWTFPNIVEERKGLKILITGQGIKLEAKMVDFASVTYKVTAVIAKKTLKGKIVCRFGK